MRAIVQRVSEASVVTGAGVSGSIRQGLLVYLGIDRDDGEADVAYVAKKIRYLRVFSDESGRMNLDVAQTNGGVLVVSAFTVQADARRGRRPCFDRAASPDRAVVLYGLLCDALRNAHVPVQRGSFGGDMEVRAVNDGPVCILLESRRVF